MQFVYDTGDPTHILDFKQDKPIRFSDEDRTSMKTLLKSDWNKGLKDLFWWSSEAESMAQTHETNVQEATEQLYLRFSMLEQLQQQGLGETPEAKFLRTEILTEMRAQESVSGGTGAIFNRTDPRFVSLFTKPKK